MSTTMYTYTSIMTSLFGPYKDVKQITGFWNVREIFFATQSQVILDFLLFQFMETTFVDGIYWEEWYNDGDMTAEFPCPGYPDHDGKQSAQ